MDGVQQSRSSERLSTPAVIPELNGVRGIAIILVLLFHFGEKLPMIPRALMTPFEFGWSGVDLFFVLSGFLITGILMNTRDAPNYFSSFYARRALRIFPIYILSTFVFFHVAIPLAHHFGIWRLVNHSLEPWYWLQLSNWQSAFGRDLTLVTHFWSLAVEEQFYLVWPMVVFLTPKSRLSHVCVLLIVLGLGLRCAFYHDLPMYPALLTRLTPFRIDTLAFGGLLAILVENRSWTAVLNRGLGPTAATAGTLLLGLLIAAGTCSPADPLIATFGFTLLAVLASCLVFYAYVGSGSSRPVARWLRHPVLMRFGKYSYGMYVLHFPICIYSNQLLVTLSGRIRPGLLILSWAISKLTGLAISYVVALASWNLVEKHFLGMKDRFRAGPSRGPTSGVFDSPAGTCYRMGARIDVSDVR